MIIKRRILIYGIEKADMHYFFCISAFLLPLSFFLFLFVILNLNYDYYQQNNSYRSWKECHK